MNVQRRLFVAGQGRGRGRSERVAGVLPPCGRSWEAGASGSRVAPLAMGGRAAEAPGSLVPVYCTHQPGRDVNVIEIRYFAAAAEAAGTTHEHLEVAPGTTLAALREALAGRGTQMARVIGLSSYLVNSLSAPADGLQELADGDRVDVLPPFAGG